MPEGVDKEQPRAPGPARAPGAPGGPEAGEPPHPKHRWRWQRSLLAVLLAAVVVAAALRVPAAAKDFAATFTHLEVERLPWLAAAIAAEVVSFVFFALLQAVLLLAGGERIRLGLLLRLSVASSGMRALLPVGVVPSSGWLLGEYRRIGVSGPLALYTVLASGFVETVSILGLLLLGSAVAGFGNPLLLGVSAVVLLVGSAGFVVLVHRLTWLQRLERIAPGRLAALARGLSSVASEVGHLRAGRRLGGHAFAWATANWLADLVCLIAAFGLLGVAIPWRGVLFAYSVAQVAGSLVPLPGGLGAVEGGLIGSLDLLGVTVGPAVAVVIVYRVFTYWSVAFLGAIEFALLARHPPGPDDHQLVAPTDPPSSGQADSRS